MKVKPINASLQPLSKFTAFAKWCQANGLIDEKSFHVVSSLEEGQQEDLSEQTLQLETVLKLKAANTDNKLNEVELMQIVEELWNAGEQKHFFPFSADVLSSIGTAATSKDLSEAAGDLICERLLATHQFLQEKGAELPRRALRFVNTVQNRQKQAAISEQLAKEGLGRKKK
ncbi:hypothetical protein ADEAN_000052600 [Angomonas deanei]|uniref:Uncharacterized protein n=1 Tax=Angomonas deanei TaxID=59799 RepID=A0A7G2C045_9TRYP|nr:hypothetical protein ADEAN_000052600 [Angomonas deanei]